jgi:sodium-dependent dicarboxylate transporter 2/3/5
LTRVLLRVPVHGTAGAEVLERARAALGPWRTPELRMAGLFALTALLWVSKSDLVLGGVTVPGWEGLLPGSQISNSTVALLFAVLAFLVPSGEAKGRALLDWSITRRLPWEVLLLLGGGFALALGFQESGLDARLGEAFGPLLAGVPTWLAVMLIALGVSFLTEITSNTATTQVLLPVLASAGVAAGVDPYLWMLPATLAASCAFMLPVATPPNAVVFASGRISIPSMARVGITINITMVILITLVFQLWARGVLGLA